METDGKKVLNTADIQLLMNYLPHRYPFLMIDKVIEMDKDVSGIGIKNVTFNEPHFNGHFPGVPIMPGVLMLEGMAQTAGVLCMSQDEMLANNSLVYFLTIDNARFRKPVVPGDVVKYHVRKIKQRGAIWKYHANALVDDVKVAEADLSAMIKHKDKVL